MTPKEAIQDFLAQKRIAVAGVSRDGKAVGNMLYKKFKDTGHTTFALNPNTTDIGGETCYPNLKSIPGGVDALMIVTTPAVTELLVKECAQAGVKRVWMHTGMGPGSASEKAAEFCAQNGITAIVGGCPLMFAEHSDIFHRCIGMVRLWRGTINLTNG